MILFSSEKALSEDSEENSIDPATGMGRWQPVDPASMPVRDPHSWGRGQALDNDQQQEENSVQDAPGKTEKKTLLLYTYWVLLDLDFS